MATIPFMTPSVDVAVGSQPTFSAPGVKPMENFQPERQIQAGQAMMRAGMQGMRFAEQLQTKLDDAKTKEFDMLLADQVRDALFNPENGYMGSIGKDAFESRTAVVEKLAKAREELENGLENDTQRLMFRQIADRRLLAASTDIDQHAMRQLQAYNLGESKARVENLTEDAAVNAGNWNVPGSQYHLFKDAMMAEVESLAEQSGIGRNTQQFKGLQREATTRLHSTVISNFIAQEQPRVAEDYLKQYRGEIDRDALDKLTNAVRQARETVDLKDQSLRLSFQVKGSLQEQIAQVDQMFREGKISADVRDATVQRFTANESIRKAQQAEAETGIIGAAQEFLLNNPNSSVLDLPTELYNALRDNGQLASMISFAQSGRYTTDPKAMREIFEMSPNQWASMTEAEYNAKFRTRLDDSDFAFGLAKLNSSKGIATPQTLEILSTADRVERAAIDMGIIPNKGLSGANSRQREQYDEFRKSVGDRIMLYEQNVLGGKRKANNQELQQILDSVVTDQAAVESSIWFDTVQPVSTMTEEELARAYVMVGGEQIRLASIPADQRTIIIRKLNERRLPVTEQAIAELWVRAGKPK